MTLTDPGGPNLTGATVSLTTNFNPAQDRLQFTNKNGISGSYDATIGILSLSGSASAATYQAALRSVTYSNNSQNPSTAVRSVQFSIGSSLANPANGHFYEFVTAPGGTWTSAKAAAESRRLFGLQGYLATVTSASENAFIAGKLNGEGWMGASDAQVEGTWKWVTGPEAGQQFWQGGTNGSAVGGRYENWEQGEPNNFFNGQVDEDYAHFRANAQWNDYRDTYAGTMGYVVEYGGMPNDPTLQIIASASVNVVAVNDAPEWLTGPPEMAVQNEDDLMAFGTTVVSLTTATSDVDAGAKKGIAIFSAPTDNGVWQFTINGGTTWTTLPATSRSNARLLPANGTLSRIRFVPKKDFNGKVQLGYYAWDQTQGTPGGTFDLSTANKLGGKTAFSTGIHFPFLTVSAVPG